MNEHDPLQIIKSTDAPSPAQNMNADIGLFNQLLQMVDGDWSDSIQGICNHIAERFDALSVVLSIFDHQYNEFIYTRSALSKKARAVLRENIEPGEFTDSIEQLKQLYSINDNFLNRHIFTGTELLDLATAFFNGRTGTARTVMENLQMKSLVAIPVPHIHHQFDCIFHISTDRSADAIEHRYLDEYAAQLNIALEIVILVRELYIKATHDGLTKLFNHKQGELLLGKEIDRIERAQQPLSIAMADVDHFKRVNDTFGHQAGDEVLTFLGNLFTEKLRKCDIISRYGGEEFLLILPNTGRKDAVEVITRIKDALQLNRFLFKDEEYTVTASFGVVEYDSEKHQNARKLIAEADRLLYMAKENGRNRVES